MATLVRSLNYNVPQLTGVSSLSNSSTPCLPTEPSAKATIHSYYRNNQYKHVDISPPGTQLELPLLQTEQTAAEQIMQACLKVLHMNLSEASLGGGSITDSQGPS